MLENYNKYKILKVFFDNPTESFRLRELSRMSKISPPSVVAYLKEFEKKELIKKYEKRGIPFYKSERDNENFKHYKKLSILFELQNTRLIDYLWDNLNPDVIILFGSFALGESIENSDIDLFVQCPEKKINLEKYEKIFGREINIFYEKNFSRLSKELRNNILNGIKLKGYLKVF
jgi:predicted nucleotidyltransferase